MYIDSLTSLLHQKVGMYSEEEKLVRNTKYFEIFIFKIEVYNLKQ